MASAPVVNSETKNAIRESILDPVQFCNKWLGATTWGIQNEILYSIKRNRRTAVKSCHTSGKTYIAARAALWWLAAHDECIVITTAPTANQVEKLLWAEIHAAVRKSKYPYPQPTLVQLKIREDRYAFGFTTNVENKDEGVKFQGFHSKNVLIIEDEAPGVPAKIQDAIEGIMSGGRVSILLIGNPTIPSGPFYNAFTKHRALWNRITISCFDTPNLVRWRKVKDSTNEIDEEASIAALLSATDDELDNPPHPSLTSPRWVKERYLVWGLESPLFQTRVLGNFPPQSEFSLFSLNWLEAAQAREAIPKDDDPLVCGIDVAAGGECETVAVLRKGPRILEMKCWQDQDPRQQIRSFLQPYKDKVEINIDSCGVGYYMGLWFEDLGFHVQHINVGEAAQKMRLDGDQFANLKAQLYWDLRIRMESGEVANLYDEMTIAQLSSIQWKLNQMGKVQIEPKDEMVKRGVDSPDRAEAVMLAFARVNAHGLIDLWEKQAKGVVDTTGKVSTEEHLIQVPPRIDSGTIQKAEFSDWANMLDSMKSLSGTKKVIVSNQPKACLRCGNTGLTMYGDSWSCGSCGSSGYKDSIRDAYGNLSRVTNLTAETESAQ